MFLVTPDIKYKDSYNEYIIELGEEERYPYSMDLDHRDFNALVDKLTAFSKGQQLPVGFVPNTTYWLINEDKEIIACSHLRHFLNDSLNEAGGHIGFGVRPRFRKKGVAQKLLELTIEKAIEHNIKEVHLHCYASNTVSIKVIESSGATLHDKQTLKESDKICLKYVYRAT